MMRIITGKARGVRLATLEGENTRPTAERAKEAVFSALQFEIAHKQVLDLFAGSGQMGLEALSRGADHAVLCDRSKEAVEIIRANAKKTRLEELCTVYCTDYQAFLSRLPKNSGFDLVFLDPPYALGAIPTALRLLVQAGALKAGAKLVCEAGDPAHVFGNDQALASHFEILRQSKYGAAYVTILQYNQENNTTGED